ncbi:MULTISPECIES: MFS transporter [Bacillus]|uniref:MFS transporter n=2 Tax=Bacillus TaxID=1386 RepID=A0A0M4FDU6_9BACI|nr:MULTISPECIES: MFS transporter [Bacillus]ALC80199.1 MFS transporter [Bacillus gobiensis]MBP1082817.1 fucose permease [Bacillus capparidis]MED1098459.1 MFS transporter [Bacillus capparidis]
MAVFFLIIIYLAFISLGLPDSLLGAAWPVMHMDYGESLETAGLLYMVIAGGTIVSSLISGILIKRFGTGNVTFISCILTASALIGFTFAPSMIWLVICCVPLGLGAGAVDSALNNYVAAHYKAHHMSWLHCFWGVGATAGPIIMSQFITGHGSWRNGYLTVAIIQFALVIILLFTLPLWNRFSKTNQETNKDMVLPEQPRQQVNPLKIKGVKLTLIAFLFYCGVEITMGLWGSSFLVNSKGLAPGDAALWVSLFYAGITVGRLITGFITMKVSNKLLIRSGQIMTVSGALLLILPFPIGFSLVGFMIVGLGLAPIYPCMLHETPARFGKENSQTLMGYQMAVAYSGTTFLPPFLGWVASYFSIGIFPLFILVYAITMLLCSERVNLLTQLQVYAKAQDTRV